MEILVRLYTFFARFGALKSQSRAKFALASSFNKFAIVSSSDCRFIFNRHAFGFWGSFDRFRSESTISISCRGLEVEHFVSALFCLRLDLTGRNLLIKGEIFVFEPFSSVLKLFSRENCSSKRCFSSSLPRWLSLDFAE